MFQAFAWVALIVWVLVFALKAAPVPTPPVRPSITYMTDGYQSLITFAVDPDVGLWVTLEGGLKPGGLDTEGPIKIGTMHARRMRIMAAKKLLTHQPTTFTSFYNPSVLPEILVLLGLQTTITITFPDETTWAFFGYLNKFEPGDNKEGVAPTATCEIVAISRDPSLNPGGGE